MEGDSVAPGQGSSGLVAPALLIAIVIVGAAERFHLLDKRDLWVDEAASVYIVRLPWAAFWHALWNYQGNMSFYYLLLRVWQPIGDSEAAIRSLSVFLGIGTIAATYLLGKLMFSRDAGLAAAALSAVDLFQIRYSQEARAYSLVMLMAVLSTYFLVRAVREPGKQGYWIAYVIASALAVYSHLYAYLLFGAQWLALGPHRARLLPRTTLSLVIAGFVLLTLPFNLFVLRTHGELTWVPRPTARAVLSFAELLAGNGGILLLAAYALACLPLFRMRGIRPRSEAKGFGEAWYVQLVASWLFFPVAATLLVSLFKPIFYERYLAICAPALVLLAGHGIATLGRAPKHSGIISAVLFGGMTALSVWGTQRYDQSLVSFGDHWRAPTQQVLRDQQPGDAIFFYRPSGFWPYSYYAGRAQLGGLGQSPTVIYPVDTVNPEQTVSPGEAIARLRGYSRVWLVLQHIEGPRDREESLGAIEGALAAYRLASQSSYPGATGGIDVRLYVKQTAP